MALELTKLLKNAKDLQQKVPKINNKRKGIGGEIVCDMRGSPDI